MKYDIGDKVWVQYGFSIYKGKVIGIFEDTEEYIVKMGLLRKEVRPEIMLAPREKEK